MTPDRSQLIAQLINAARERDEAERAAFLAAACGGDTTLRREIESLLGHGHSGGPSTTATSSNEAADIAPAVAPTDRVGFQPGAVVARRIGSSACSGAAEGVKSTGPTTSRWDSGLP